MINHYLYIEEDGTWNWSDNVFSGIATLAPGRVSEYCLEQADKMRNSNLGNYDDLTAEQRERLAKLWEAAVNMPVGEYDYYFNLENKYEVFKKSVEELAKKLGIDYEPSIDNKEKLGVLKFIRKEIGCGLAEANDALLKFYRIEEAEELIDKFNMLYDETDNQELIRCLNDAKKHLMAYKEHVEQELSKYNLSYND